MCNCHALGNKPKIFFQESLCRWDVEVGIGILKFYMSFLVQSVNKIWQLTSTSRRIGSHFCAYCAIGVEVSSYLRNLSPCFHLKNWIQSLGGWIGFFLVVHNKFLSVFRECRNVDQQLIAELWNQRVMLPHSFLKFTGIGPSLKERGSLSPRFCKFSTYYWADWMSQGCLWNSHNTRGQGLMKKNGCESGVRRFCQSIDKFTRAGCKILLLFIWCAGFIWQLFLNAFLEFLAHLRSLPKYFMRTPFGVVCSSSNYLCNIALP